MEAIKVCSVPPLQLRVRFNIPVLYIFVIFTVYCHRLLLCHEMAACTSNNRSENTILSETCHTNYMHHKTATQLNKSLTTLNVAVSVEQFLNVLLDSLEKSIFSRLCKPVIPHITPMYAMFYGLPMGVSLSI